MSELMSTCPSCNESISIPEESANQEMECPYCQETVIPSVSGESPKNLSQATPEKAPPPTAGAKAKDSNRVAILTPHIKREVLRAVRRLIADESNWMPSWTPQGDYAYAAKRENGELVKVEVTSDEATVFSLLGAVLCEFQKRNVTRTASGRSEFLDQELPQVIQEVVQSPDGSEEGANGSNTKIKLTHAQSMQVLDVLEERYTDELKHVKRSESDPVEDMRLEDLNRKIERKIEVSSEEMVAALSNELGEINERLKALEQRPQ